MELFGTSHNPVFQDRPARNSGGSDVAELFVGRQGGLVGLVDPSITEVEVAYRGSLVDSTKPSNHGAFVVGGRPAAELLMFRRRQLAFATILSPRSARNSAVDRDQQVREASRFMKTASSTKVSAGSSEATGGLESAFLTEVRRILSPWSSYNLLRNEPGRAIFVLRGRAGRGILTLFFREPEGNVRLWNYLYRFSSRTS